MERTHQPDESANGTAGAERSSTSHCKVSASLCRSAAHPFADSHCATTYHLPLTLLLHRVLLLQNSLAKVGHGRLVRGHDRHGVLGTTGGRCASSRLRARRSDRAGGGGGGGGRPRSLRRRRAASTASLAAAWQLCTAVASAAAAAAAAAAERWLGGGRRRGGAEEHPPHAGATHLDVVQESAPCSSLGRRERRGELGLWKEAHNRVAAVGSAVGGELALRRTARRRGA